MVSIVQVVGLQKLKGEPRKLSPRHARPKSRTKGVGKRIGANGFRQGITCVPRGIVCEVNMGFKDDLAKAGNSNPMISAMLDAVEITRKILELSTDDIVPLNASRIRKGVRRSGDSNVNGIDNMLWCSHGDALLAIYAIKVDQRSQIEITFTANNVHGVPHVKFEDALSISPSLDPAAATQIKAWLLSCVTARQ